MRAAIYSGYIILIPLTLMRNPSIPSHAKFAFLALLVRELFNTDYICDRIAVQSLTVTQRRNGISGWRERMTESTVIYVWNLWCIVRAHC